MKQFICSLFFAGSILFLSCNDPLDITPDGRTTIKDVFLDADLTEAYLNTVYSGIRKYACNYHDYVFMSSFSDDSQDSEMASVAWSTPMQYASGLLTATWNPIDNNGSKTLRYNDVLMYDRNWEGIRKANVFLTNVNEKNVPDPALRGKYIAEAKILRALFYWDIVKLFGPMPFIDRDIILDLEFDITRPSFSEITACIVKDCDEALAEPALPYRVTSTVERGRMTKAVAHAIKSQILLINASPLWNKAMETQKWTAAAKAAKEAITDLEAHHFELYPDYAQFFYIRPDVTEDPADKESILEISDWGYSGATFRRFCNILYLMQKNPGVGASKAGNCPSQELVDTYDMADGQVPILGYEDEDHLKPIINKASGYNDNDPYVKRDPRFYATVWYNGSDFGNRKLQAFVGGTDGLATNKAFTQTGYYMKKYIKPGVTSSAQGDNSYRLFRFAELYLNFAEAENEVNGPTTEVYNSINKVRNRAGMPSLPQGLSKETMRDRIRRERRVEFALEENRFYDMRRWNILNETGKVTTGMRWTKEGTNERVVTFRRLSYTDKYLLFPIPIKETVKLKGMTQNPGWE